MSNRTQAETDFIADLERLLVGLRTDRARQLRAGTAAALNAARDDERQVMAEHVVDVAQEGWLAFRELQGWVGAILWNAQTPAEVRDQLIDVYAASVRVNGPPDPQD